MKKYCWGGDDIPTIEAHSIKKHEVLREYLMQYIKIVGGGHFLQKKLTLTLIDGFAGGGLYIRETDKGLHYGSPLIFLNATKEAETLIAQEKQFALNAHYFFIEKDYKCFSFLKDLLIKEGFGARIGQDIFLLNTTFEEQIENIVIHIKKRGRAGRCIFLLDQYGYLDVNFQILKTIFRRLPHAEVILTFAVDFLIDYMTASQEFQQRLYNLGSSLDISNLSEEKAQKRWRFNIQHKLYEDIKETGALFYTNFFIKSRESHRSYWLVHLSMHPKAKDEMQALHWNFKNSFIHEGKPGLYMLGYDPKNDSGLTRQSFLFSEHDQILTHETLFSQIPSLLDGQGIQVRDFYTMHCNQTPATLDMMQDVLKDLYIRGEIDAITQNGTAKRGKRIQANDVILRKRQLIFHF